MPNTSQPNDPLGIVKNFWGKMGVTMPGMVVPTLDVDELDKRIADYKSVEGWLKMNLNMLQMSIKGLEMQRSTLVAMKTMVGSGRRDEAKPKQVTPPFDSQAAMSMWPWSFMQKMGAAAATATKQPASAPKEAPAKAKQPASTPKAQSQTAQMWPWNFLQQASNIPVATVKAATATAAKAVEATAKVTAATVKAPAPAAKAPAKKMTKAPVAKAKKPAPAKKPAASPAKKSK